MWYHTVLTFKKQTWQKLQELNFIAGKDFN